MTDCSQQPSHAEEYSVYPIMYLEAEWSPDVIGHFALGVRLLRAGPEALKAMQERVEHDSPRLPGSNVFEDDVHWLLAVPFTPVPDHVPVTDVGISFRESVELAVVGSFLLCLRLTRQTASICPVSFCGRFEQGSLIIDTTDRSSDDYYWADYDRPCVAWCERFDDGDLTVLTGVWDAMVELRQFARWRQRVSAEAFFADLDCKASQRVPDVLRRDHPTLGGGTAFDNAQARLLSFAKVMEKLPRWRGQL